MAEKPRRWTETRLTDMGGISNYDLSPDAKRIAAIVGDNTNNERLPTSLAFRLNFFEKLRRKAPPGK